MKIFLLVMAIMLVFQMITKKSSPYYLVIGAVLGVILANFD